MSLPLPDPQIAPPGNDPERIKSSLEGAQRNFEKLSVWGTKIEDDIAGIIGGVAHASTHASGGSDPVPGLVLTGGMIAWPSNTIPADWLLCDGSAISRTTYAALFAVCGTTYGTGDGSTTFNLPDLRGRVPVGKGTHADVDALNDNDGLSVGNRRPKHRHSLYDPGHIHGHDGTAAANYAGSGGLQGTQTTVKMGISSNTTGIKINPGGASSDSTSPLDAPAFIVLNYIIKA